MDNLLQQIEYKVVFNGTLYGEGQANVFNWAAPIFSSIKKADKT